MFKVNNKNVLLTLNIFHTFFSVSIVDFEQVNVSRVYFNSFPDASKK